MPHHYELTSSGTPLQDTFVPLCPLMGPPSQWGNAGNSQPSWKTLHGTVVLLKGTRSSTVIDILGWAEDASNGLIPNEAFHPTAKEIRKPTTNKMHLPQVKKYRAMCHWKGLTAYYHPVQMEPEASLVQLPTD